MTGAAHGRDEPTQSLTRAYAVAAALAALPAALREAALVSECQGDQDLARQVRQLLAARATPAASPAAPGGPGGQPFGHYLLREVMGTGSTGVVHRATEVNTGREVAIKRLHPGADAQAAVRLHREVLLLGQLQHPGIVQVLDAGHVTTAQGQEAYLAMELVTGPPLIDGADSLGLDLRDRVRILVALCRAVAHAHRRGIIHRDLKPQNIRLDLEVHPPAPRVLDFGVATPNSDRSRQAASDIVGTLGYLAPEQLRGAVDVRCDVYSLGAIAYQLLSGHRAFDLRGLDVAAAGKRLQEEEPPPPSRHRPALRGDFDAMLAKALARDPGQRYASADELGDELQRWLDHRPVEARPATALYVATRFVQRQPVVAALTALCATSVLLGLLAALVGAAQAGRANQNVLGVLGLALAELGPKVHGGAALQSMPEGLGERIDDLVAADPFDPRVLALKASFLRLDSEIALRGGKLRRAQVLRRELVALRERITAADPSPQHRHELAIALVLLGDTEKELVEPTHGDTEAARQLYLRAHDVFAQFAAARPEGRTECDDLVHSHLRLAHLDLRHDRLDAAEPRIEAARLLVERLQQNHADHPYTQAALREFLGICGLLASKRGDELGALDILDRALLHILRAHQLAPNDLHIAEFALATATARGRTARLHGDLAKAHGALQLANSIGRQLTRGAPTTATPPTCAATWPANWPRWHCRRTTCGTASCTSPKPPNWL
ncbi:MAG: serine/threonine protein kinase [Planctomycetes bacterium]|nr:serine/threonine protein kinase [Planctomycetota bacterium]